MSVRVVEEVLLTANLRRLDEAGDRSFKVRIPKIVAAIKATNASAVAVQECPRGLRVPVMRELGWTVEYHKGNVGWIIDQNRWTIEHDNYADLETGADDRYAVAVVVKHRETGRERKLVNVHLTNEEAPGSDPEAWRRGQLEDALSSFEAVDAITGDFNSTKLYTRLLQLGYEDLWRRVPVTNGQYWTTNQFGSSRVGSHRIDNWCTVAGFKVLAGGVFLTGKEAGPAYRLASDHNFVWAKVAA